MRFPDFCIVTILVVFLEIGEILDDFYRFSGFFEVCAKSLHENTFA